MKKYLIYLLTLVMILSPAAVFAGEDDSQADPAAGTEVAADADQDLAAPQAEADQDLAAPQAETAEELQDEDLELTPAGEETTAIEAKAEQTGSSSDEESDTYTWATKEDGSRDYTKAVKDGQVAKGLFKAKRFQNEAAKGTSLFYATETGVVEQKEQVVTASGYVHESGNEGESYIHDSGTHTYLITKHDGYENPYFVYWKKGLKAVGGNTYYVQDNGTVRTDAGVQDVGVSKYYVKAGGALQMSVGFTPDHKYYIPKTDGKILTTQGTFKASDGKTYYAGAGGVIPSAAGLYSVGSTQYYVNADGSVKTDAGFITVSGKKYLVQSGGAISKKAGVLTFGGKKYAANSDGSIITKVGFANSGGKKYYVSNTNGVLAVNKAFKVGKKQYHALADGTIAVGVHKWGKYYYYGDGNGVIRTKKGIVRWAGNGYYVGKGGKITTNKKIKVKKKYYIAGSKGAFLKGLFTWKKSMYYASGKGVLRTKAGVFSYDGSRYCSKKGGKLYKNALFTMKGKKYLAQSDGKLKSGYFTWKKKMYLTDAKCAVITKAGLYTYGKNQYYVTKGGPLAASEFVEYKDKHYYCGSDGAVVKKSFKYKGIKITPNSKTGEISNEEYWKAFPDEAPKEAEEETTA